MRIKELQNLLDSQPSVSANTFLVGALYLVSWILAVFFLTVGIGLLLESFFGWKIFLDGVSRQFSLILNEDQRQQIALSFGLSSLILAVIFAGVIYLCKMILRRNHYIIQTEDWLYSNISEIKKSAKKNPK